MQQKEKHVTHYITEIDWDFIVGDVYNNSVSYPSWNYTVNCTHTIIFHITYARQVRGVFPFEYRHACVETFRVESETLSNYDIADPDIAVCLLDLWHYDEIMMPGLHSLTTDYVLTVNDYEGTRIPIGDYKFWIGEGFNECVNDTLLTTYITTMHILKESIEIIYPIVY